MDITTKADQIAAEADERAVLIVSTEEHLAAAIANLTRLRRCGLGSDDLTQAEYRAKEARNWVKSHGSDAAFAH